MAATPLRASRIDKFVERFLASRGQRISRRGILGALGRGVLRLVGISLVPLLPVDRRFQAEAQGGCPPSACGMCGNICNKCCNKTGSSSMCPDCGSTNGIPNVATGGAWCGCCQGEYWQYNDCCGNPSYRNGCQGTYCGAGCAAQGYIAYCPTGSYICTTMICLGRTCVGSGYTLCPT